MLDSDTIYCEWVCEKGFWILDLVQNVIWCKEEVEGVDGVCLFVLVRSLSILVTKW